MCTLFIRYARSLTVRFNDDLFIWLVEIGYMNLHENTSIWLWVDKDNLHFTSDFFFRSRVHPRHTKKKKTYSDAIFPISRFVHFISGPVLYTSWFKLRSLCLACSRLSLIALFGSFIFLSIPKTKSVHDKMNNWKMRIQKYADAVSLARPYLRSFSCNEMFFFFFGPQFWFAYMYLSLSLSLSQMLYVYHIHIYTRWISRDCLPSLRDASIMLQWYMRVSFCLHFTLASWLEFNLKINTTIYFI